MQEDNAQRQRAIRARNEELPRRKRVANLEELCDLGAEGADEGGRQPDDMMATGGYMCVDGHVIIIDRFDHATAVLDSKVFVISWVMGGRIDRRPSRSIASAARSA